MLRACGCYSNSPGFRKVGARLKGARPFIHREACASVSGIR